MNFNEIYALHSCKIFNLALHYVQNREDAEEITQDVFVAIHESLSQFQEKSSVSTWIYRITINKSLDFIKAKNRKKRVAFFTSIFTKEKQFEKKELIIHEHPGILLEQKESLYQLFKWINELPEQQKTVIILSKIEGRNHQEIADILEISYKAVESLMQRAKMNLSKKMNPSEGNQNKNRLT